MMKEEEPPPYDDFTVSICPSGLAINSAYVPDEDLTGRGAPPSPPVLETGLPTTGPQISSPSFPPLTTGEIKHACHFYISEKCCYGSKFIENMTMTEVIDRIAYHYTLESFGEKRETADKITPFYGGAVDGTEYGEAPGVWDVPVIPSEYFSDGRNVVEIPHTSYIKMCIKCNGKGTKDCKWCFGIGGSGCVLCLSSKRFRPCTSCKYSNRRCWVCNGTGEEKCQTCDGQRNLKACKILIVTWANHQDHFVTDTMDLPPETIIKKAKGKQLLTEVGEELSPVWNVPNAPVISASTSLINKYRTGFQNEVIRKQRHTLRAVPFTQVKYRWRDELGHFYIYGLQKLAYFEEYPQHCCCCCSIM